MQGLLNNWLLVIELGRFRLQSVTPWNEIAWFVAGLILLTGSSAAVLWWARRSRPDPFI